MPKGFLQFVYPRIFLIRGSIVGHVSSHSSEVTDMKELLAALALVASAAFALGQEQRTQPPTVPITDDRARIATPVIAPPLPPRVVFNGVPVSEKIGVRVLDRRIYLPMLDGIALAGFDRVQHDRFRETFTVWRGTHKVQFMLNSRMMRINHVPVVVQNAPLGLNGQMLMPLDTLALITGGEVETIDGEVRFFGPPPGHRPFDISPALGAMSIRRMSGS
jgi:hypothetical protein